MAFGDRKPGGSFGQRKSGGFGESGFDSLKKKPTERKTTYGPKPKKSWLPPTEDAEGQPVEMTTEQRQKLYDRALNLCVWHLGQSMKTRKQLRDAMAKKDVPDDLMEQVLDRLVDLKYLDDQTFAEAYVRERSNSQRQGSRRIQQDLRRKGVESDLIDTALEQIDPDEERANALVLVERKLPSTRGLDRQKRTTRLVGMLTRKGYNMGLAFEVIRQAMDNEANEDPADE